MTYAQSWADRDDATIVAQLHQISASNSTTATPSTSIAGHGTAPTRASCPRAANSYAVVRLPKELTWKGVPELIEFAEPDWSREATQGNGVKRSPMRDF